MKGMKTKFLSIALVGCIGVTAFAGCGATGGDIVNVDNTKTQLAVHSYAGGVGVEWLNKIAREFEKEYADTEFEPGKKGVQILDSGSKNIVVNTMSTSDYAVYFAESVDYATLVAGNKLLDISDVVTSPLSDVKGSEAESATIESKMYDGVKAALTFSDNDAYYAIPHYTVFSTVTYNKQLFEDKGLYFADSVSEPESIEDYFINKFNKTKSCGPDGIIGNEDDGLPATWDEFRMLCDYMDDNGVAPFIWATGALESNYLNYFLNSVYLNLSGQNQASLKFTFDSKGEQIDIVNKFNANGAPEVEKVAIDESNYKLLEKQLTKYQTLTVAEEIYKKKEWHSPLIANGNSMLDTQNEYIRSYNEGKPIAFLIEGSYWYNEANMAQYFENAELSFGAQKYREKNDYLVMPLPRYYEGSAADIKGKADMSKNTVIADQSDAFAFINANIANNPTKVKLAKTFLKYCYTDKALKAFTEQTGVPRYLQYDVDATKLPNNYAKSVWNMYKNSDMVVTASDNPLYLNSRMSSSFILTSSFWAAKSNTLYYLALNKGISAKSYFEDMWNK